MDELIARLEAPTEPDRLLDEAIATYLWGEPTPSGNVGEARVLTWWHGGVGRSVAPRFTESLDEAMTLLPKGFDYGFSYSRQHGLEAWVQRPFKQGECFQGYAPEGDDTDRTRAKAICIAALRARAAGC